MSFIFEKKISDEDRAAFDFKGLLAAVHRVNFRPTQWVVDRERGAVVFDVETNREPPHETEYALSWKGRVFRSQVLSVESFKADGSFKYVCRIVRFFPPTGVSRDHPDALSALELTREGITEWARATRESMRIKTSEIVVEVAV